MAGPGGASYNQSKSALDPFSTPDGVPPRAMRVNLRRNYLALLRVDLIFRLRIRVFLS